MTKIKFGTDGWRAIIAKEFTVDNVARVAKGTADWILANADSDKHHLVLGHDCRFAGPMFAATVACVMAAHNIKVYMAEGFVSTPMVSFGAKHFDTPLAVIVTASHNPPEYNGYKLKAHFGGPASPKVVQEVEDLIPDAYTIEETPLETLKDKGLLEYVNLEDMYYDHVSKAFDFGKIADSGFKLAYDAMYGAGQRIIKRLLPDAIVLHDDENPGFHGTAPEPIPRNLGEFEELLRSRDDIDIGLVTDGDADRIGLYDGDGNFVDAHHVLLLLTHYLHKYKGMDGKVVIAFSVSPKVKALCDHYGLEVEVTKIGFKYIAEKMVTENILVGGEESGGIAVKGHIPERDGIWDGLVILELMAKTGKTLRELIQEVYDIVGSFAYHRNDLHLDNDLKWNIIKWCGEGKYTEFGGKKVLKVEDIDGYKFHLEDDHVIMIRPSGTEPVLRVYGEAPTRAEVDVLLESARDMLLTPVA